MIIKVTSGHHAGPVTKPMRCPACLHNGHFETLGLNDVHSDDGKFLGQRRCPSEACHAHAFVVFDSARKVIRSYPPMRIDFDSTNIPGKIKNAFDEAIACHSIGAYVASAMLVRKTL